MDLSPLAEWAKAAPFTPFTVTMSRGGTSSFPARK